MEPLIQQCDTIEEMEACLRAEPRSPAIIDSDSMVKLIALHHCPEFLNVHPDSVLPGDAPDGDKRKALHTIIRFAGRTTMIARFSGNANDYDNGWMAVIAPATMSSEEAGSMFVGIIEATRNPSCPADIISIPRNPSNQ